MTEVCVQAHSNIALIKYWGKRADADASLNLPDVGSLSLTLGGMTTTTSAASAERDEVILKQDGVVLDNAKAVSRAHGFMDTMRAEFGGGQPLRVESNNDFPTGAGLASSASGFAALALVLNHAWDLQLSTEEISAWARRGSGSAARSLWGGFVVLERGELASGRDCRGRPLLDETAWPLEVVVAVTAEGAKEVGSTEGMVASRNTSDFYNPWVDSHSKDLAAAEEAVKARDFDELGKLTELSTMKMHAVMLTTWPTLCYWTPASVEVMTTVQRWRKEGAPIFFTMDAGPQVKVVCAPGEGAAIAERLESLDGVVRTIHCPLGRGARLV